MSYISTRRPVRRYRGGICKKPHGLFTCAQIIKSPKWVRHGNRANYRNYCYLSWGIALIKVMAFTARQNLKFEWHVERQC